MKSILVILAMVFTSGCAELEKIQTDLWNIDSSDGSVYRTLDNGTEEYFFCTDSVAEDYIAIHEDDAEKWFKEFRTSCICDFD